jgi:hypothetical protein
MVANVERAMIIEIDGARTKIILLIVKPNNIVDGGLQIV